MHRRVQAAVLHPVQHPGRMTGAHGKMFTSGEAAKACRVDRTTIARAAAAGRIPGAARDDEGAWTIPLSGLLAAGYEPGKPSPPEGAEPRVRDEDAPVPAEVFRLSLELERARAEARAQASRADALERVLIVYERQLEAPPSAPQTAPPTEAPPKQPLSAAPPPGNTGKLRRAWNVLRY